MRTRMAASLVGIIAIAGACSSEPDSTTVNNKQVPEAGQTVSSSPEDSAGSASGVSIDDYMQVLTDSELEPFRDTARKLGATSPAAVYLDHLANVYEAALDGGAANESTSSVEQKGNDYELCPTDAPDDCLTFSDFQKTPGGDLVDFAINGKQISSLVSRGNGRAVTSSGAKFTFLTAYRSQQSNAVFVTMRVETGNKPIQPNVYSSIYRSPDGKQRTATDGGGPTDVGANSTALIYSAFKSVESGGTMTLDGCVGADCAEQFKIVVRTR